jgi:thiamine-phosphate pyrophosphorylase
MRFDCSLYLVTDESLSRGRGSLALAEAAMRGGVTMLQYRAKGATTRAMLEEANSLLELCRSRGVPLIINDRADVAMAIDADGLHVGQSDLSAGIARRLLAKGKILGVSVGSPEQARRAIAEGADYLGASPIFATPTKRDAAEPMGIEGLRSLAAGTRAPVVAIGGINAGNAAAVIAAGAAGIAVVSAIVAADDAEAAARSLRRIIDAAKGSDHLKDEKAKEAT